MKKLACLILFLVSVCMGFILEKQVGSLGARPRPIIVVAGALGERVEVRNRTIYVNGKPVTNQFRLVPMPAKREVQYIGMGTIEIR